MEKIIYRAMRERNESLWKNPVKQLKNVKKKKQICLGNKKPQGQVKSRSIETINLKILGQKVMERLEEARK